MNRLDWEREHGQAALAMLRSDLAARHGRAGQEVRDEAALARAGTPEDRDEFFVQVIPKTDYSFDGRSGGGGGSNQYVTLAAGIDTSSWVSGVLLVRLHAKNTWASAVSMRVHVENISLVPEDPSVIFPSTAAALATAFFSNSSVAPSLTTQSVVGFADMVQVRLQWQQGAFPGTAQTFSLSVDLMGRPT